jgi:hypothetical protein
MKKKKEKLENYNTKVSAKHKNELQEARSYLGYILLRIDAIMKSYAQCEKALSEIDSIVKEITMATNPPALLQLPKMKTKAEKLLDSVIMSLSQQQAAWNELQNGDSASEKAFNEKWKKIDTRLRLRDLRQAREGNAQAPKRKKPTNGDSQTGNSRSKSQKGGKPGKKRL